MHALQANRRRNDLQLYEQQARQWWNPRSRFAGTLHALNEVRLQQIREHWSGPWPPGRVADLGCGGGLMAEPLARAGARVVGLDLSLASLRAAAAHGRDLPALHYVRADAGRSPLPTAWADCVLCADVIEHVADPVGLLREVARILAPGGLCYLNTLNRSWQARLLAVMVAEGIGLVPRGTHDWRLFRTPDELQRWGAAVGLRLDAIVGERPSLRRSLRRQWLHFRSTGSAAIGYSAFLRRTTTGTQPAA